MESLAILCLKLITAELRDWDDLMHVVCAGPKRLRQHAKCPYPMISLPPILPEAHASIGLMNGPALHVHTQLLFLQGRQSC